MDINKQIENGNAIANFVTFAGEGRISSDEKMAIYKQAASDVYDLRRPGFFKKWTVRTAAITAMATTTLTVLVSPAAGVALSLAAAGVVGIAATQRNNKKIWLDKAMDAMDVTEAMAWFGNHTAKEKIARSRGELIKIGGAEMAKKYKKALAEPKSSHPYLAPLDEPFKKAFGYGSEYPQDPDILKLARRVVENRINVVIPPK